MFLPRATEGRVWLSLFIDAGARDADPPQLATLAAWTAAGDAPIEARVLPDGIELSRPCSARELDACLASLARAVSAREPSEGALRAALARLASARRRAAGDEARRADALAMEALLGAGVDPLGAAEDDPRVDARRVGSFLAAHAGAGRVLLVVIGDVSPSALRPSVLAAFSRVPRAMARRAERPSVAAGGVRVEVGSASALAAATLRPSIGEATRLARRLVARLDADLPGAQASAEAFPLRGGAAVIARLGAPGEDGARVLLDHLAELGEQPAEEAELAPPREGPRALARWIGAGWAARQEHPADAAIGVGVIVAGGRGDRVGDSDPDRALRASAERAVGAALREASAPLAVDGVDADGGEARALGASVRLQRLPGAARLSALVLFEGGASEDPADAHGLTAVLAQVAADGCERIAQRELGATLASLGAEVAPVLTSDAWGLRVEGPSERWRELAHLAPRCAAVPDLDPWLVEHSRATALARAAEPRRAARALAAALLAPGSPGRVAPEGSARAIGGVGVPELVRARATRVGRARARIAVAGDAAMDGAARVIARAVRRWPAGLAAEPGPWRPPSERLAAAHASGHEALVAWVIEAPGGDAAARAFAEAAARALSGEPGLRARWHEGGAGGGRAFALVSLDAAPESIDALPAHVTRALRAVSHAWPAVAEAAAAEAADRRAWARSTPRGAAAELAMPGGRPTAEEVRRLALRLAESPPYFLILRPQPGR